MEGACAMTIDLEPAAQRVAAVVAAIPDAALGGPTPCPDYAVADLLEHVGGLALAFRAAADKDGSLGGQAPVGDASRLPADWRTRIPADLVAMARAWHDPQAWTGMTRAGGVDLPGEVAGLVALDEIVIHGWDLATAIGIDYDVEDPALQAVHDFVKQFDAPADAEGPALFGPPIDVPDAAPLLDRVVGLTGRRPDWSPATQGRLPA
jgi:uncharacterized protein (TIGR03086 family)